MRLSGFESTVEPLSSTVIYLVAHMSRLFSYVALSKKKGKNLSGYEKRPFPYWEYIGNTFGNTYTCTWECTYIHVFPRWEYSIPVYSRVFPKFSGLYRLGGIHWESWGMKPGQNHWMILYMTCLSYQVQVQYIYSKINSTDSNRPTKSHLSQYLQTQIEVTVNLMTV